MSILDYNEIREKKIIIHEDEPCEVIESHVARTQMRKPQNQVKLKSLISGKTFAATFHAAETAEEADVEKRDVKFLYQNKGEYWFCPPEDPKSRFKIDSAIIGDAGKYFKENANVTAMYWISDDEEQVIKVTPPIKITLTVKEAPPAVKGDTAKGGNKLITLENGLTVSAPMFIEPGDQVVINTENGQYVERV